MLLGMLSTHFRAAHRPSDRALRRLDLYARHAADFIERERTQQDLRASEARYRMALAGSPVAVWECDRDLRFTFVDNSQPPVSDPAFILGRRDDEILPLESVREIVECKKRVLDSGKGERREVRVRLGDVDRWFELVCEPVRDESGAVAGLRGIAVDVT